MKACEPIKEGKGPVRRRSRQEALKALHAQFIPKDRVLITIDPDPDSIAAAIALKRLMWHKVLSTTIGLTRPMKRLNNLTLVRLLRLPMGTIKQKDLKEYDKFLLVDGQPHHNEFFAGISYTAVIDHHPLTCEIAAPFVDVRPEYGATSTIMMEYLKAAKIKPSNTLATALIYGIKTDTRNFERQCMMEDVKAFHYLFGKANHNIIRKVEISDLALKDLNYFEQALRAKRVVKDRIYTHLDKVASHDILVIIAEFLLKVHDISWSIVSGIQGSTLIVVIRNDGYRKDAGRTIAKAFGDIGSAGGHQAMARAEIPLENLHSVLNRQTPVAIERFVRRRISSHS
jgi:nanoRNase/pAp phosphatase (c-di-AMP/oligoRNAs hydrolase)